ncbi:uncharacterized protein LOC134824623 [Bolinopsis microptera]|uniref:uncharacterized protein LOC134824623 n=1 Tax=Bolinopsis microptera TaxID=2820187 RepID=UPI00307A9F4E
MPFLLLAKLLILLYIGQVQCSGRGQIQFLWYNDTRNMDRGHASGGNGYSDFFFRPVKILDKDETILYDKTEARTETLYSSTQTLDLSRIVVLKNPLEIALPTDKTVYVYISVYDEDGNKQVFTRTMTKMWVPFESIQVGTGWTIISYSSSDGEATLSFKYRLLQCDVHFNGYGCNSCKTNYYPKGECTVLCEETSSSTCNEEGEKVCRTNYYPEGECTVLCDETSSYTCNNEGGKVCRSNYYPKGECNVLCEETSSYTCNNERGKVCRTNYYPEGECTVLCDETSSNICNNEGVKVCRTNYYPEGECNVLCDRTSSYNCNNEGGKVCKTDYYPENDCSTYCSPVKGNYTCNQVTGHKICGERRTGEECDECVEHHFGETCSNFCKGNEDYICSEIGKIVCNDESATPENNCNKNNIPTIAGIGAGVVVLLAVIILGLCKCYKKSGNKNDVTDEEDNIYNTLEEQEMPINSKDENEPTSRIRIAEDADDVYSTMPGEDEIRSHPAQSDDAVYSTLAGREAVNVCLGNNMLDDVYCTLNGGGTAYRCPEKDAETDDVYSTLNRDKTTVPATDSKYNRAASATVKGKYAVKDAVKGKDAVHSIPKNEEAGAVYSTPDKKEAVYFNSEHEDAAVVYTTWNMNETTISTPNSQHDANYSTLNRNNVLNSTPHTRVDCSSVPVGFTGSSEEDPEDLYSTPHKLGPHSAVTSCQLPVTSLEDDHLEDDPSALYCIPVKY